MAQDDYYKTLGVKKTATRDEINRAFRRLAKKYHPDRNQGDKQAEKRFKEISAAHEVLGDAEKRRKYDQLREAQAHGFRTGDFGDFSEFFRQAAQGGGGKGGGLGDIFSSLFGGGGGAQAATARPQKGENILRKVEIPFMTAARGGTLRIPVRRLESCPICRGSGARPGTPVAPCATCGGRGTVQTAQGGFAFSRPCPECLGRGKRVDHPCTTCQGQGSVERDRKLSVPIPQGIREGKKIRLSGEGKPGLNHGPPGDLYLQVHILRHPTFEREDNDIYSTVELNIAQATLGARVGVQTLDGAVDLHVPPGTASGAKLRIRGKGVGTRGGARGNHYVRVKIVPPKNLTAQQADLVRKLAHELNLPT